MSTATRRATVTVLGALLGLAVAVGLAVLTSKISTQRVGLAGESPRSGRHLVSPAPKQAKQAPAKPPRKRPRKPRPTVTVTPTPVPPAPSPVTAPAVPQPTVTGSGDDRHGDDRHGDSGGHRREGPDD